MIAFKYEAEQAITKLVGITVQVGKTGKLTPVADLVPVPLAGTTVKRASLHNADEILRKDVRIGDTVVIQKAGEIIPQVVRVEVSARDGSEQPFDFPTTCPSCGAPVTRHTGEVDFHCTNSPARCPEQLKEWIRWYAHRDAMDVDGLGTKLIHQLVDRGLVKNLADLYRLDAPTLAGLERMGKKSADNLVAALEATKHRTLDRLITGLTIRHVGTRSAEILAERYPTLDNAPKCPARSPRGDPRDRPRGRVEHLRLLPGPREPAAARRPFCRGRCPRAAPPRRPPPAASPWPARPSSSPARFPNRHPRRRRSPDQAARRQGHRLGLQIDLLSSSPVKTPAASSTRPGRTMCRSSMRIHCNR